MALLTALIGTFLVLFTTIIMVMRRRFMSGSDSGQRWAQARQRLSMRQQIEITMATNRKRPVEDAALRPAQLAFLGRVEEATRQYPLVTSKWARWMPLVFGALAAWSATWGAVAGSHVNVFYEVEAGFLVVVVLSWIFGVRRAPARQRAALDRLARLRRILEDADDQPDHDPRAAAP